MVDFRVVQQFYGRWARYYDLLADSSLVGPWRERVVESLALEPGDVVVEMGCGTGVNFPRLRNRVGPSGTVIGVDLTRGMLAEARERVGRAGWSNVHLLQGDATRPPITTGVDAVLGTFVVGLFDDPASVIDGWLDLLAPGGRLAVLEAGPSDRPIATPLNLAFRAFTRLSAPSSRRNAVSPAVALDERIRVAFDRIDARTAETIRDTLGLGFVRLSAGRRP
ncbi:trans-aconitate 2-methyltransferase protein [Halorhabdus tiamatea SARL4B]|uniref:Methyltransferase type 11 n=1 Tax=Halorhabdus tiamatea SARL4B TaxID=1033806 RepID=F7PLY9_9EURY|nr:methyltransferase domain-containing protein [Halorhabdus tiamatea]ERJ06401.1 trans-aconitate 2-methyltransferase protein [Halorhabdus tiamatea SARL4B]CCQ34571.1 methyltransferase type 11 [Halorhabdus tiamatea SARL4B]